MRSSGTAYVLPMVVALLLARSASGSPPQAGAAREQQAASGSSSAADFQAHLPLVLLDVTTGNRNLKAEDFTILEDGKVQKLVFFKLQQPAKAAASGPKGNPQPPELAPSFFTNAGPAQ